MNQSEEIHDSSLSTDVSCLEQSLSRINFGTCKHIHDLPYSILLKIFSYLTVDDRVLDACLVSKYWYQICFDGKFWQKIDFEDRKAVSDDILEKSARHSDNVTNLSLLDCGSTLVTPKGIIRFSELCPNLQELDLKNAMQGHIGDDAIDVIASNCTKLRHLNVDTHQLTDEALKSFAKHLPDLEHLNINQNRTITDDGVIPLVKHCKKLKELIMSQIPGVTGKSIAALGEREKKNPVMEKLNIAITGVVSKDIIPLKYVTNLTFLDLTRCRGLCYEHLVHVLTSCRKLKIFHATSVDLFDDKCVELAVKNLKNLGFVYFGSMKITDVGMDYLAKYGKNLYKINVPYTGVTHKGAENVCKNLPKLTHVGMTRCDSADEDELELLVQRYPHISFSTFRQDAKRMLMRAGKWHEDEVGIVTKELIMQKLCGSPPPPRRKPRRLIGTGGKIEYITIKM
ncbi:unnamed protein product [Clavelina lepadiformis]|uniref:F-box domain-containing protein n=2 Tax=Clavelina lepadiformis TaxID=159417 RepID=A0ABP0FYI6_CLALP